MAENLYQLVARAKWCRRLARDALDEHVRISLEQLAQDCERRGRRVDQS